MTRPCLLVALLAACASDSPEATPPVYVGGDTDEDTASETDSGDPPADADADGFTAADGDCDDTDATIFPGADEIWSDDIDQDCDGADLTQAEACVDAVPCPDAVDVYARREQWDDVRFCSTIPGVLTWTPQSGDGPIPNNCVVTVGKDIAIEDATGVVDLRALGLVETIGQDLKVNGLPDLRDLGGLTRLRSAGEHILIERNPLLTEVDELAAVESVGEKLTLADNGTLSDIDGLRGVMFVGDTLTVAGNPALCAAPVDELVDRVRAGNPAVEVVVRENGGC